MMTILITYCLYLMRNKNCKGTVTNENDTKDKQCSVYY